MHIKGWRRLTRHALPIQLWLIFLLVDVTDAASKDFDPSSPTTSSSSPTAIASPDTDRPTTSHHSKSTSTIRGGIPPFKGTTFSHHTPVPTHPINATTGLSSLGAIPSSISQHPGPPTHHFPPPRAQSGWLIALEVGAALVGIAILVAVVRCVLSYKKTPRYHHARQESIQEIRRDLRESRIARLFHINPPPPYETAPDYDAITKGPGSHPPLMRQAPQDVPAASTSAPPRPEDTALSIGMQPASLRSPA